MTQIAGFALLAGVSLVYIYAQSVVWFHHAGKKIAAQGAAIVGCGAALVVTIYPILLILWTLGELMRCPDIDEWCEPVSFHFSWVIISSLMVLIPFGAVMLSNAPKLSFWRSALTRISVWCGYIIFATAGLYMLKTNNTAFTTYNGTNPFPGMIGVAVLLSAAFSGGGWLYALNGRAAGKKKKKRSSPGSLDPDPAQTYQQS